MSDWSFDLTNIPRGRTETKTRPAKVNGKPGERAHEVFIPEPIWVETHKGEVIRTYYCRPTNTSPKGYWPGVGDESCIKCWQLFVRPEPSGISMRSDAGLDIVHIHSEINLPVIDDCGSGA